ncbi:unnamed protein product, partial [Heterosigma akashiwo]
RDPGVRGPGDPRGPLLRDRGGHVEHGRDRVHPAVRVPPVLRREQRRALPPDQERPVTTTRRPFWDDVSPEAKALIDSMLVLDPARRATAAGRAGAPVGGGGAGLARPAPAHVPRRSAAVQPAPQVQGGDGGGGSDLHLEAQLLGHPQHRPLRRRRVCRGGG